MTLFEGREVDAITVKLKSFDIATHDTFHLGAEVYVLARATIKAIDHPDKDGVLVRCQVAAPDDGWLVPQLTAARMIDAVEPPKLPGTERVHDKSKDATLDVQVGDDGSVTFIDTTTGEKHTAATDEETAREKAKPAVEAPAEPAVEPERAASMAQRIALTKQITMLDEKLTNDLLEWQRTNGVPLNPKDMTFEQARRTLVYVGDVKNSTVEDG